MTDSKLGLRFQSDFDNRLPKVYTPAVGNGQTIFVLPEEPLSVNIVFEVNTVAYHSTQFFTIGPPLNTTITWLNVLFSLDTFDTVRIIYYPAD